LGHAGRVSGAGHLAAACIRGLARLVSEARARRRGNAGRDRRDRSDRPADRVRARLRALAGLPARRSVSNRVVAFFTILVTLATAVASLLVRVPTRVRWLAWGTFVGTLAQAPLGAITVYYHLNPWLVISHLLLSLVVLGVGVLLVLEVFARPSPAAPVLVRWGSLVALAALCVLVVSGTIVSGSGPHPGGADVRRLGAFEDAIWLHVRATAVFGILFLVVLFWAARQRGWAFRGALAVLALLLLQMAIGEIQYRNALPWWLVLVHVTMAAAVWGAAVAFVASIWRSRA
jgi:cytochrome c oxidase assembly protein subunit 15